MDTRVWYETGEAYLDGAYVMTPYQRTQIARRLRAAHRLTYKPAGTTSRDTDATQGLRWIMRRCPSRYSGLADRLWDRLSTGRWPSSLVVQ